MLYSRCWGFLPRAWHRRPGTLPSAPPFWPAGRPYTYRLSPPHFLPLMIQPYEKGAAASIQAHWRLVPRLRTRRARVQLPGNLVGQLCKRGFQTRASPQGNHGTIAHVTRGRNHDTISRRNHDTTPRRDYWTRTLVTRGRDSITICKVTL